MTPEAVVQAQLDAYNAHDPKAFLACFAEDVTLRRLGEEAGLDGREALGAFYAAHRFNLPGLRAELRHRAVLGTRIVDHERVHGLGPEPVDVVAIYDVDDDAIRRVWIVG